ncbi:unnamed protein product, partial [Oppiella nova]
VLSTILDEDIVISGMGGRYPESNSTDEFAHNLFNGIDMITEDNRRWPTGLTIILNYACSNLFGMNPRMGKLKSIEKFDGLFFGIMNTMSDVIDPQSRMALETTYECIIDAGINPQTLRGSDTGVYIGFSTFGMPDGTPEDVMPDSQNNMTETLLWLPGSQKCLYANRVSFVFDFKGPSMIIDTACSSSLVALNQAVNDMRLGKCRQAIVGGTQICLQPFSNHIFQSTRLNAMDGIPKVWDEKADGFVRGETVCCFLLQRKSEAKRIYATVLNSGVNIDGNKRMGMFYPSAESQEELMIKVYEEADVDPLKVNYFEAHATGTKVGDPQEAKAIYNAYCGKPERKGTLNVGLLKSNIGHAEGASGLSSVTKVLIAFENECIPPNLHLTNIKANIKEFCPPLSPVVKNTKYTPGIAGVNNFGVGGVNANVLLEPNYKVCDENSIKIADTIPRIVNICCRTEEALNDVFKFIENNPDKITRDFLALMAETMRIQPSLNSSGFPFRGSIIMKQLNDNQYEYKKQSSMFTLKTQRPVYFLFPGLGGQWVGMAKALMPIKIFADKIEECHEILKPYDIDLKHLLLSDDKNSMSNMTNKFCATTAIEIALCDVIQALGIIPDGIMGHSFGEIAAAYADGCLKVYEEADVDPLKVNYFEAHATGTKVGDPQEAKAIYNAYCGKPERKGTLNVGLLKSNIGHAEGASGLSSVTKVLIAFENECIPPALHLTNIKANIKEFCPPLSPVVENTKYTPGVNIDGNKRMGMFYPSAESQEELMIKVYEEADVDPLKVNYFEAHATGTKVGDPQEAKAIYNAYCGKPERKGTLNVGLLKSNIGHAEGASGLSSVTKVLIAFENECIPPALHLTNIKANIKEFCPPLSPVVENTKYTPGVNIDGNKRMGMFYPSAESQEELMIKVYEEADVDPLKVNYFEAHATGTKVGDPQEAKAIYNAYCGKPERKGTLNVGLLKSNIGHAEGASGLSSVTKVLIAFENECIPPALHLTNIKANIKEFCPPLSPVVENTKYTPGVNIDGNKRMGMFYPSAESQEELMIKVYEEADVDPLKVNYFEAHATGTKVGDPQEAKAIYNAYCGKPERKGTLNVGLLKSNIGHAEGASGLSSVTKVLIAFENECIPPALHLTNIKANIKEFCPPLSPVVQNTKYTPGIAGVNNSHAEGASGLSSVTKVLIAFENECIPPNLHLTNIKANIKEFCPPLSPVVENTKYTPGIAGVNNFGVGGVNANVLLEPNYKVCDENSIKIADTIPRIVNICCRTEEALNEVFQFIENNPNKITRDFLALMAETMRIQPSLNSSGFPFRGSIIIKQLNDNQYEYKKQSSMFTLKTQRPVYFLFPGLGGQWVGMAKALMPIKIFADKIEECHEILKPYDIDLKHLLLSDDKNSMSNMTNKFCATTAIEIALCDVIQALGIIPDGIMGHSFGEIAAAYADGCLNTREALLVTYYRGVVTESDKKIPKGLMAVVGLSWNEAKKLCPKGTSVVCNNGKEEEL